MSMISAQIDELRKYANKVDGTFPMLASAMRDAADTIGELCVDLQQANAENARLRTQLADVTESMGRVEERCAKLREERNMYRDLVGCMVHPDVPDQLAAENAELRELVRILKNCADECGDCDTCPINGKSGVLNPWLGCDSLRDRMRELGVEP